MRYRFQGISKDTGRPVEGHVDADREERAYMTLSDNGVVTSSLVPDPLPGGPQLPAPTSGSGSGVPMANAIDTALNHAASQVPFDAIAQRYRGKQVWVIDRDKIRQRVAAVVDQAIQQSLQGSEGVSATRQRVAGAIDDLFRDNKNLTSQATANNAALERQISRLGNVIRQAENLVASMTMAISRMGRGGFGGGGGGGGGPRRHTVKVGGGGEQDEVLAEIFKANLDLIRSLEQDLTGGVLPLDDSTIGVPYQPPTGLEADSRLPGLNVGEPAAASADRAGPEFDLSPPATSASRPTRPPGPPEPRLE